MPDKQFLFDADLPFPSTSPFTRRQSLALGLSDNQLGRLCRQGQLRRMLRSVYTAAWLHSGNQALPPNAHLAVPSVSVFRPPHHGRMRTPISISGERTFRPDDLMTIHGVTATTPLRTGLDIGRFHQRDVALWGIDLMHSTGAFTHEEFMSGVKRLDPGHAARYPSRWTDA